MTKVTLDREAFKALASDSRLDILRKLDGKKMSLSEISRATNLNKATLHEHLSKLCEADLVKRKDREGHKWVYYKLSWKGESLLHPENTKIVVMFSLAFIALMGGIVQMFLYAKGTIQDSAITFSSKEGLLGTGVSDINETIPQITNITEIEAMNRSLTNFNLGEFLRTGFSDLNKSIPDITNITETEAMYKSLNNFNLVENGLQGIYQDPTLLYASIVCFMICIVIFSISVWHLWKNRTPKL